MIRGAEAVPLHRVPPPSFNSRFPSLASTPTFSRTLEMKTEGEENGRDSSKLNLQACPASVIPAALSLQRPPPPMDEGRAATASASGKRSRSEACLESYKRRWEKKMRDMYDLLRTMVPTLVPKATIEKTVSETIEYIKELERMKDRLEKMKEFAMAMAATPILASQSSNLDYSVKVAVSGNVAFFGILSAAPARRGLATQIIMVFEKHMAQVLAANVTVNDGLLMVTVTAFVGNYGVDTVSKIIRDIRNL